MEIKTYQLYTDGIDPSLLAQEEINKLTGNNFGTPHMSIFASVNALNVTVRNARGVESVVMSADVSIENELSNIVRNETFGISAAAIKKYGVKALCDEIKGRIADIEYSEMDTYNCDISVGIDYSIEKSIPFVIDSYEAVLSLVSESQALIASLLD